jgi:ABC-type sugar transport system substrate-binding protein
LTLSELVSMFRSKYCWLIAGYVGALTLVGCNSASEKTKGDRPKVLMIRYQAGSESTEQREAGFRETIQAAKNIEFMEAPDEAGATVDSAQRVAETLLNDHDDLDGIFVPNESSSTGVLRALELLNRGGKVKLVGFDASVILIDALAAGKIHGLVLQDPFDMGYQSVMRVIDHLEGKPLPKERIQNTNLQVVTPENMNDPAIKGLYARDLSPFLEGSSEVKNARWRVAVIPKGTTHDFWKSIHAGAIKAAREHGNTEILWEGPAKEDQRHEQQQIVERFTSEGVSAIVLAPCDRQTLVIPVEGAIKKGIPVVIIDSGLEMTETIQNSDQYLGYVATDNHQGGVEGAKRMIELLKAR